MANISKILGQEVVLANLKKAGAEIALRHQKGLSLAGLVLQAASQRKTPVEFGVLRASATTRRVGWGLASVVQVGYTANYALFVHEAEMKLKGQDRPPPSKGKYWDPQGQATSHFLSKAAEESKRRMVRTYKAVVGGKF